MIGKYEAFFSSIPKFFAYLGLCKEEEIKGCGDKEIKAFGDKWNLSISPVLWAYLRYLGNDNPLEGTEYNLAISLLDIDYAMTEASQKKDWLEDRNLMEFIEANDFRVNYDDASPEDNEGIYTPGINSLLNSNDALFFVYHPSSRSFSFFDSKEDNPIVYNVFSYRVITSQFHTLTTTVRDMLFTFMLKGALSHLPECWAESGQSEFEALGVYKKIFNNLDSKDKLELRRLRDIFYQITDQEEKETEKILSIGDYEAKFVEFLDVNNFSHASSSLTREAINC